MKLQWPQSSLTSTEELLPPKLLSLWGDGAQCSQTQAFYNQEHSYHKKHNHNLLRHAVLDISLEFEFSSHNL